MEQRDDARELDLERDRFGAGSRGLAADVEHGRAVCDVAASARRERARVERDTISTE